jgi:hypothetical protein
MSMDDGLTQGTKAISLSLHLAIVVTDTEVSLLQRAEPDVELQNTRRAVAEELSLDCKPRLVCGLRRLPNDLRELQNDRDLRSYVLEAGSRHMQMHGESDVGVGADVDGAIIIVVLGDHDAMMEGPALPIQS